MPKIENPLKSGLRQWAALGLSKERLKRRDYARRNGKINFRIIEKWQNVTIMKYWA